MNPLFVPYAFFCLVLLLALSVGVGLLIASLPEWFK